MILPASYICRHIAAADHYDIAAKPHGIILIDTAKEIDACYHAFRGFAGHAGKSSALKADGNVEGLETAVTQLLNRYVFADFHAALYFGAHALNDLDLSFYNIFLKTERRNAIHEHTAGAVLTLKDCDGISFSAQVISGTEACRACPDDSNGIVIPLIAFAVLADGQGARPKRRLLQDPAREERGTS